jgi:phospholipase/lecithinase/hemolysin
MHFPNTVRQVAQATIGGLPLTLLLQTTAVAAPFSQLYVFGDSLSDIGNLSQATFNLLPPAPYAPGRLSNGPLWVDYLATDLGLPLNLTNNFAFAGARTDNLNGLSPLFPPPLNQPGLLPGLQQQIDRFVAQPPTPDNNALFILWAGANDYLDPNLTDPLGTVTASITNITASITRLANAGAKTILVPNLPDLGQLPLINLDAQRATNLNTLTGLYNAGLAQSLGSLAGALQPDVKLIGLDVNTLFQQAVTNPSQFGLNNVTDACFAASPLLPTPPATAGSAPPCSNPDQFLFWDGFHPTTAGHQAIGDLAFSTLNAATPKPVPETLPTVAVLAFGVLVGTRLRRKAKSEL